MEQIKTKPNETLTDWIRAQSTIITHPIARFLGKLGIHPNTVTLLGFFLNVGVAVVLARGHIALGGGLLLLTSSVDALDGALARLTGAKSRFGAFLDSTLDRVSEGALLLGLLAWLLPQYRMVEAYLVFVVMLGSVMVSYTRARAEGVGFECKVGLLTRVERVLILGIGLMLGWIMPMLALMSVLVWITVVQRIWHVYREGLRSQE